MKPRRMIGLLLALLVVAAAMLPRTAAADPVTEGDSCGDGVTWTLNGEGDDLTLTISKTGDGSGKMDDYDKSNPWVGSRYSIKSVVIEDGVTSIGSYAFSSCTSLESVSIPNGVTSIGSSAFFLCESLEGITIPNSVKSIGSRAFDNCTSLGSVTIPNGVTSIGSAAFFACRSLEGVSIPNSVTSIGSRAFEDCSSLESVTIPNGVTSIEKTTFSNCTSLKNVEIPDSVTSIESGAFVACKLLESVTIPDSVKSIGESAFRHCASLTNVTIPASVTSIEATAFQNCTNLKHIFVDNLDDGTVTTGNSWFDESTTVHWKRTVTATANPAAGGTVSISPSPDSGTYWDMDPDTLDPTVITVTAEPKSGLAKLTYAYGGTEADITGTGSFDMPNADVTVTATFKPKLTITAYDQTYEYNGQTQGEGDTVYADAAEIASKVKVEGLQDGDALTSITIDGQGTKVGEYPLVPSNAAISGNTDYVIEYVNGTLKIVNKYTVSVTASPKAGGTVTGEGRYFNDAEVILTATPSTGYRFVRWESGDEQGVDGATETEVSFAMPEKNVAVTAVFELETYEITFVDWDGTVLKAATEYPYGTPAADVAKPANPTRPATEQYEYTFAGWDPEVAAVTADATYTASYTEAAREYTITFVDWDGTVLQSGKVAYGTVPAYTGEEPSRAATEQYEYAFSGWLPEPTAVTGDATYTATYGVTPRSYTITFVNWDGTVLQSGKVAYGATPTYKGETPTRPATAQNEYTFAGWLPEIAAVTGDATYTATYTATPIPTPEKATLTFDLAGGTMDGKTGMITVEANVGDTITIPGPPTREGYAFKYWRGSHYNPGDSYAVVGDHFFSAVWEAVPTPKTYTVTFDANGYGTAPAAQKVEEGKTATKPTDPTAEGWTFGGWYLDRSCTKAYDFSKPVTADITLYAKWTKQENKTLPQTGDPAAAAATLLAIGPALALAGLALRRRAC